jgi:prepilin-type N-terminal cleavage/methylation domain-containing protein
MYLNRQRRPAFTLIELLVVIGLILLIAAITVVSMPSVQDRAMQSGADQMQGWLLIAKQRAKRDGKPTGLRIMIDPATSQATQCFYIQQPEDYRISGTTCKLDIVTKTVTFLPAPNGFTVDLAAANVQTGDYIEFYRGGGVYFIKAVTSSTTLTLLDTPPDFAKTDPTLRTAEYRIRRQPILLSGEDALTLPSSVVIDNTNSSVTGAPKCQNLPIRTVVGVGSFYEVLFDPKGGIVGRGSGGDQICVLWLSNTESATALPLLVAIQSHTGFIAVQPDAGSPDPYKFCRDGRASGL